jgi:hypothetical protein
MDGLVVVGRGDDDAQLVDDGAVHVGGIEIAHGDSLPASTPGVRSGDDDEPDRRLPSATSRKTSPRRRFGTILGGEDWTQAQEGKA